jgi:hypothetical protein
VDSCKLLCPKEEATSRLLAWAALPENQKRIKEDKERARQYVADFRKAHEVSFDLLHRRITI